MKQNENSIIATTKIVAGACVGILLISACGGYSPPPPKPPSPPNIAPRILRITPNAVRSGLEKETIIIRGAGFNENCLVLLDAERVDTQYGDGGILFAKLNKLQLEMPRTAILVVTCPLQSNQVQLQIK